MIVHGEAAYFRCARAIIRAKLWETAEERRDLPNPDEIFTHLSQLRLYAPSNCQSGSDRLAGSPF